MSVELEKQSLATLKEWVHLLGIRGMSNARKAELIDLLSKVGDKRIEYAMSLAEEKKKQTETEEKVPEAPAEPAPAEKTPAENLLKPAQTTSDVPERRTPYRRTFESSFGRSSNRSGFGSYAPSYRAQAEASENQERPVRNRYELPLDKRPIEPERPVYRNDDDDYYGGRDRNDFTNRYTRPADDTRYSRQTDDRFTRPADDRYTRQTDDRYTRPADDRGYRRTPDDYRYAQDPADNRAAT